MPHSFALYNAAVHFLGVPAHSGVAAVALLACAGAPRDGVRSAVVWRRYPPAGQTARSGSIRRRIPSRRSGGGRWHVRSHGVAVGVPLCRRGGARSGLFAGLSALDFHRAMDALAGAAARFAVLHRPQSRRLRAVTQLAMLLYPFARISTVSTASTHFQLSNTVPNSSVDASRARLFSTGNRRRRLTQSCGYTTVPSSRHQPQHIDQRVYTTHPKDSGTSDPIRRRPNHRHHHTSPAISNIPLNNPHPTSTTYPLPPHSGSPARPPPTNQPPPPPPPPLFCHHSLNHLPPQTAEVRTHLDKLVTESLELSKLRHLSLGFAYRRRMGQSLGDGFTIHFVGESKMGPVCRLARLVAATACFATTTGSARDGTWAKIAELSDLLSNSRALMLHFGDGIWHEKGPPFPSVYHTQGNRPPKKKPTPPSLLGRAPRGHRNPSVSR